jgi:transcription initiation factor TFIID subunit 5
VVLATGGADATVRLWEVAQAFDAATSRADDACTMEPSRTFHTKSTPVVRVKWTRRNLLLAAGAFDMPSM